MTGEKHGEKHLRFRQETLDIRTDWGNGHGRVSESAGVSNEWFSSSNLELWPGQRKFWRLPLE